MKLVVDVENTVTKRDGKMHLDPFEPSNKLVMVGCLDDRGNEYLFNMDGTYQNNYDVTIQELLDQAEDKFTLDTLQHKFTLESGQVALTGEGSIMLEDYHDYSTGQPALLMMETFTGTDNIQTQSPYADNLDLNKEAGFNTASLEDDILDFTERNPFGEVDE